MSQPPVPPRPPARPRAFAAVTDRLALWRDDPRVGIVTLLVAALVAGVVWYQLGTRGGGAPASASEPAAQVAARDGTAPSGSSPSTTDESRSRSPGGGLLVHVAGAVARAGVVRLHAGARVADAIAAAGGAVPGADVDRLNLAAKVADGQRVAVPKVGEPLADAPAVGAPAGAGGVDPATTGPLNLNTATQAQLEALPGIGPTLAAAILRERERRGGFRRVEELREVRGIGDKRFDDLRPLVGV